MARLPLPTRESLPKELQERWDRTVAAGPMLDIQRLFFVNPDIRLNALAVWRATGLSPRAREIVILRAAFRKESRYEWHQHVRISRDAGLRDDEINAVTNWQSSKLFSDDQRALLAYVDDLAEHHRASDESFAAISRGRQPAEIIAITYLITLYFQLAQVMATMDLQPETEFVGWEVK
jgi:alkylhydroperoxidase family enzyme